MKKLLFLFVLLPIFNIYAACSPYTDDPNHFQILLTPNKSYKTFITQQDDNDSRVVLRCSFNPQTIHGDYLDLYVKWGNGFDAPNEDITADPEFPVTFYGKFTNPVKPEYSKKYGGYVTFTLQDYPENEGYQLYITCCDPNYKKEK